MEGQRVEIPDWVLQELGRQHLESIMLRTEVARLTPSAPAPSDEPLHAVDPGEGT